MALFAFRLDSAGGGEQPVPGGRVPGIAWGHVTDDGSVEHAGRVLDASDLVSAPAIPRPGKVICVGLNYRDHVEEQHIDVPDRPLLFAKFPSAVVASGQPIVRPAGTHALDLEVELGVVIGRRASRVRRDEAMAHVAGYVTVNDVTARDWQGNRRALGPGERGDGQWLRAKGSDTFLPMAPVFVRADELPDPYALRLRSWRVPAAGPDAGTPVAMQDGTTADMLVDIPGLIEFITATLTLEAGDIVATGTPSGVGVFRDPPIFLEPGDRAICEVEGIGRVENHIVEVADVPRPAPATAALETR
jgi:2-keto-4-pentenoate hydratase/2-oxohepta-3-ene-1,7-dioic acid hydratase in catechol pathway